MKPQMHQLGFSEDHLLYEKRKPVCKKDQDKQTKMNEKLPLFTKRYRTSYISTHVMV
jgi:hypothetical protein